MKTAFLFCHHTVPYNHPNAVRFLNTALILQNIGFEVSLFGADYCEEYEIKHKGINCTKWKIIDNKKMVQKHLRNSGFVQKMKEVLMKTVPDLIISCLPGYSLEYVYLKRWAHSRNIPLIQNLCEWYNFCNFQGKFKIFRYLRNEWSMRVIYAKMRNIIGISTFLTNYYEQKGVHVINIPTLVDIADYNGLKHRDCEKIRIAYAGSPRAKDKLANVIYAISSLSKKEQERIQLHIYGATIKQIQEIGVSSNVLKELEQIVYVHGNVPYHKVAYYVTDADFTILLRPNMRYANAGFPTKVGESLACGTPVISNLTSDLQKYLIDGENSIICRDCSIENCIDALHRVLNLKKSELYQMRISARQTAEKYFDYHVYSERLKIFVDEAINECKEK